MSTEDPSAAESIRRARVERLESLGILAAGLAHDFKNMLVGVLVNAQLALRRLPEDQDRVAKPLHDITHVVDQASALCDRLLAYAGRGVIQRRAVDLNDVAKASLKLAGEALPVGVRIDLDLASEGPQVLADDLQLKQVAMNLLLNAAQATGEGGAVRLETGVVDCGEEYLRQTFVDTTAAPGRYAFLVVSDDGPGIPADVRERMFDPFFTTRVGGRGMGLAAVLGIVRLHAGAIQVYSEPGQGTRCKVLFPLETAAPAPAPSPDPERFSAEGTVLLVDDDPMILELGRAILEEVGFTVLTATNGLGGVEALASHPGQVRAVLLDLTMPEMDGIQAMEALRDIEDVPILLMSGYPEVDVMRQVGQQPIAGFVEKPYRPETLVETLRQVLNL